MEYKNIQCGQNVEFFNVKVGGIYWFPLRNVR